MKRYVCEGGLSRLVSVRLVMALTLFVVATARGADFVAPVSWYLPLPANLAEEIRKFFPDTGLPDGLYYTNQRESRLRSDLRGGLFRAVRINVPEDQGGGTLDVGFAGAYPLFELWAVRQGYGKFLLGRYVGTGQDRQFEPSRFMNIPYYFISVRDGVMAFDEDWIPYRQHLSGTRPVAARKKNLRAFTYRFNESGGASGTRAAFQYSGAATGTTPIFVHNPIVNKMVMAVWPTRPESTRRTADLAWIDLEKDTRRTLLAGIAWPFYLTNSGVFYASQNRLEFRAIQWDRGDIGDAKVISAYDHTRDKLEVSEDGCVFIQPNPQGKLLRYILNSDGRMTQYLGAGSRFSRMSQNQDDQIKDLDPVNLPDALAMGEREPLYSSDKVNAFLASSLGGSRNSWSIIVYEEGQMPEEAVASFVWESATGMAPVPDSLKRLDRVYEFQGAKAFSGVGDELQGRLAALHDVIDKKRGYAILRDFPTRLPEDAKQETVIQRMRRFWTTFEDCIGEGTCRVVITMRKEVYTELSKLLPGTFNESNTHFMGPLDSKTKEQVTRIVLASMERRHGKKLSDDGLKQLLLYSGNLGQSRQSPGNEVDLLTRLFDYVSTNYPGPTEIDPLLVGRFIDSRRGLEDLKTKFDVEGLRAYLKSELVGHRDVIDQVCNRLLPVKNGTKFGRQPLALFVLLGTPGVGKSYLAELVATYLTKKDSLVQIDMSAFQGFNKENPSWRKIHDAPDQLHVVNFDDVDRASPAMQQLLAGIIETGVYGQGTEDEVWFSNSIVFFTANWGQELIMKDDHSSADSFRTKLRRFLTTKDADGKEKVHPRLWSRMQNGVLVMKPFSRVQMVELAFQMSSQKSGLIKQTKGKELLIDPRLLVHVALSEDEAQAGARTIRDLLESNVYPAYDRIIDDPEVRRVLLIQHNDRVVALSEKDGATFDDELRRVQEFMRLDLAELVKRFGGVK